MGKATLIEEAAAVFGCKATPEAVSKVLWALGLREPCSRCHGSGHYSFCEMYGTKCFGCMGHKERAAKLTKKILAEAKAKVEAGELDVIRERGRAKLAAKARIAPIMAEARKVYEVIADTYTVGSLWVGQAGRGEGGAYDHDEHQAVLHAFVTSPLYHAQHMNNAIYFDYMRDLEHDVEKGRRRDYERVVTQLEEGLGMLRELVAAWEAC